MGKEIDLVLFDSHKKTKYIECLKSDMLHFHFSRSWVILTECSSEQDISIQIAQDQE